MKHRSATEPSSFFITAFVVFAINLNRGGYAKSTFPVNLANSSTLHSLGRNANHIFHSPSPKIGIPNDFYIIPTQRKVRHLVKQVPILSPRFKRNTNSIKSIGIQTEVESYYTPSHLKNNTRTKRQLEGVTFNESPNPGAGDEEPSLLSLVVPKITRSNRPLLNGGRGHRLPRHGNANTHNNNEGASPIHKIESDHNNKDNERITGVSNLRVIKNSDHSPLNLYTSGSEKQKQFTPSVKEGSGLNNNFFNPMNSNYANPSPAIIVGNGVKLQANANYQEQTPNYERDISIGEIDRAHAIEEEQAKFNEEDQVYVPETEVTLGQQEAIVVRHNEDRRIYQPNLQIQMPSEDGTSEQDYNLSPANSWANDLPYNVHQESDSFGNPIPNDKEKLAEPDNNPEYQPDILTTQSRSEENNNDEDTDSNDHTEDDGNVVNEPSSFLKEFETLDNNFVKIPKLTADQESFKDLLAPEAYREREDQLFEHDGPRSNAESDNYDDVGSSNPYNNNHKNNNNREEEVVYRGHDYGQFDQDYVDTLKRFDDELKKIQHSEGKGTDNPQDENENDEEEGQHNHTPNISTDNNNRNYEKISSGRSSDNNEDEEEPELSLRKNTDEI